jgi:hypothetical protein
MEMIARLVMPLVVLGGAAAAYVAWPFWSAAQLRDALVSGDVAAVARSVEWPSLRSSVKDIMSAELMREMSQNKDTSDSGKMAAGFMALLGPVVVEPFVESAVIPQGLVELLKKSAGGARSFDNGAVKRSALAGPTRFEFELGPAGPQSNLLGIMELRDFTWKLTQVIALRPLQSWYPD